MRSKLIILFFALIAVFIFFNRDQENHNQFSSDSAGYYLYLPAIFIYNDLETLSFVDSVNTRYNNSLAIQYSLYNVNGKKLNKYTVGVSFFECPFFIIANAYCKTTSRYKADGFSMPYQLADLFSNIFWTIAGLFVLRNVLKRYFNENVVAITIFCIAFGTNLYVYTAFVIGMSHPYSFFLFACLLYLTDKRFGNSDKIQSPILSSLLIGVVLGLIVIVRPVNIFTIFIPLVWRVNNISSLKERIIFFIARYKNILITAIAFLLPVSIQFFYWKYITGHWLCYSYKGEYFNFLHPHIIDGLFSYRKGWFIYSPMMFLCFLGFYFLRNKHKAIIPVLLLFFILMIYVVFSWREWWYGGGFGCRPLIESIIFLSLPLAAIIEAIYFTSNKIKKTILFSLIGAIITLNIFQTYQFSMGLIHWDRMTKEYYWQVFGKIQFDRIENEKYLIRKDDEYKYDN